MKIDLHTHILPRDWPNLDAKYGYGGFVRLDHYKPCCARMMVGDRFFRNINDNVWDPTRRIEEMDGQGVSMQVLSTVPVMFSYWAKPSDALDLSQRLNDHIVREGETFFIPPNVPHSPQRPPHTIGLVVERRRPPGEKEHVIFYCENCGALVEDIHFDCKDIVDHFSKAMLEFWSDDARRTCKKCGKKVEKAQPVKSL